MAEQQAEQRAGDDAAAADGAAADGVAAEQAEAAAEPMQQDGEADGGASEAQA